MKELTVFLEKLAEKLGTTVEKLWAVLLKQAPISGTVDLLLCIALVCAFAWAFRLVQKKTTIIRLPEGAHEYYQRADWEEEGKILAWLGIGVAFIFVIVTIIVAAEGIVTAFFNPEYWALQKVLRACR